MKVIHEQEQYPVNHETLDLLYKIAAALPRTIERDAYGKIVQGGMKKLSGQELIDAGIRMHYNKRVLATGSYHMRLPQYMNHRFNVVSAYKEGGPKAVKQYCKEVRRFAWKDFSTKNKFRLLFNMLLKPFKRLFIHNS